MKESIITLALMTIALAVPVQAGNIQPSVSVQTVNNQQTRLSVPIEAQASRIVQNFNFGWEFHRGDLKDVVNATDNWENVNLPHDFQISQPWIAPSKDEHADNSDAASNVRSRLSSRAFKEMGIGWYRKSFTPDASWRGKRILIDFEGIMLVGDVYLNGERVGGTDYGYVGFEIDLTSKIKWDQPNVITVKANTQQPNNSRWYTGGGLFRDVHLVVTDTKQYFARHPLYVTMDVNPAARTAQVYVQAEMANYLRSNHLAVAVDLIDAQGKNVYHRQCNLPFYRNQKQREYAVDTISINQVNLWSCEQPYLYTLRLRMLRDDNTVADEAVQRIGIRKIEYSPSFGLRLNGEKVLLKGIANHHTLGALGAAAYPRAIEKRIKLLKEFGFNHVRTSHNPYSESFLNLCDEYGILVVDELYDKWLEQFAGGRIDWTQLWQYDVPEFVKRDRNHPSVVMWSLGNELQTYWNLPYQDWGVTPYKLQRELLHRYDNTRPVTVAMHPRGRNQFTDSLPAPLALVTDVAAYNYRYMYFPGDSRRYPNMMFYQSEANNSNMGPNYFDMDLDKVIGLAYWGMIDYLGESNGWPAKGWNQGVFDISLEPKPTAWFLRSIFNPDEPIVRMGIVDKGDNTVWNDVKVGTDRMTSHWNRTPGTQVKLYTYTNADEVELVLNGKSLGKKKNDRSNSRTRNKILWDKLMYQPGTLIAKAYIAGKLVATHQIETTGAAVRLRAEADAETWQADGMDLQHVRITCTDTKDRVVAIQSTPVHFTLSGDAEIVGVINGDMDSDELTVGDTRSLYNGTCTVILRSHRSPSKVVLTAAAEGLKSVSLKLNTK